MTSITSAASATTTAPPGWLRWLLRIDAIGSVVIGLGLLGIAGWLASPMGLGSPIPILLVAALFVVNGPVNGVAARKPTRASLLSPIAVDTCFGLAMLLVALADPAGAELWARWAVAVVGLLSLDLAAAKLWGRARLGS